MKRRGFFSRLLGLAAVPFVPDITPKEKKNESFVGDGLDHKCIDRWAHERYRWGPLGAIRTGNTGVSTSGSYSIVYDPAAVDDGSSLHYVHVNKGSYEDIRSQLDRLNLSYNSMKQQYKKE